MAALIHVPEAGRKALEHHNDSDWTVAYIVILLIPVVFVAVALYSTWRDRGAKRAADVEMAMQANNYRRRTWFPDAVAASENPRRPPAAPLTSHPMTAAPPRFAAARQAGESSRTARSGVRNHPVSGSAFGAPPSYGGSGRPLVSVTRQSGLYAHGSKAHVDSPSSSKYPRDLQDVTF